METLQNENKDWEWAISWPHLEVQIMVFEDKQNTFIGTIQSVRHLISIWYDTIKNVNLQPYSWLQPAVSDWW